VKKEIFEWAILIWASLLVLLITGWVMIEFYDWKDTIVAAIIAFVGAVIGGSITLIGVNRTIRESRRKDEIEKIKSDIFTLSNLSSFLMSIREKAIHAKDYKLNPKDTIKVFVKGFSKYDEDALLWIIDKEVAENYNAVFMEVLSKEALFEICGETGVTPIQFHLTLEMELGACVATIEDRIEFLLEKYGSY